jgi:outer membrane usher protein
MGGRLPSLWHCGVAALVLGWPSQAAATDGSAIYGDLPPPPARAAIPGEQKLELELVINGLSAGFVAPVMLSGGRFRLRLADLKRAGVHIDAQGELLFLDEMPGVTANYDQRLQRLAIDVPASYLPAQRLGKKKRKFTPASYDVGALLNYDAYVSGGRGTSGQASLFHEARAFGAAGTLSTTGVVRSGPGKTYVRYDTRFRRSDEATATTIEVGDFITRSLPWASAVRLGGIQVSRDFGVRPDIITYPLPQFAGSAALPSTVELLVGNQRIAGGEVKPGPFALDTLPPINGAGEANLIVTDMNGRSIQTALPFYVSSNLLAPGLTDYAVAFGALRQNYGIKNFDYGSVAGSASLRHGLTNGITLEVRAEVAYDMQLAGGGAVVKLGNGGVLSGSYSRSFSEGRSGDQYTLGYEYQARIFSLALRHSRQSADYADLGLIDAAYGGFARSISSATLTLALGPAGTFGLGYFDVRRSGADDSRFANASWSLPLFAGSRLNASATREFEDRTWSGALTFSIPLGGSGGTASAGVIDTPGVRRSWRADLARSVPTEGGIGWSAGAALSEDGHGWWRGDIVWRTDPVQLRGGAYGSGDATFWAGASGSLVLMDGALFAANRVSDAFVVVSTDGTPDIPVRYENQLIGKTNADGKLLIPWASAYYPGKYEIDPLDLPANVLVPTVMQTVAVASGSGAVVRFPVERRSAARAILRGPDGLPLAAGTPVLINDEVATYVGWDGLLFVEQAKAANRLAVRFANGSRCTASFAVPEDASDIFDIGDLTCAPAAN